MRARSMQLVLVILASLVWVASGWAAAGKAPAAKAGKAAAAKQQQIVLTPDQIQWKDGPPELPGAQMAVLEGDPKAAGFFVMRVKFPAGTKIPLHMHENVERVTVLSGKLNLVMADKPDNPIALPAGSYFSLPARTLHNAYADEETIVQIGTTGRWSMRLQKQGGGAGMGGHR